MKAKIIKRIPSVLGLKTGSTYQVYKTADNKEGVYLIDDYFNNVYVDLKNIELLQEDGVDKVEIGKDKVSVTFTGLLPKNVSFDPATKQLLVSYDF